MPSPRRFPSPWTVKEQPARFVVRDHNGQQLAYVYFEDEPGRRSAAELLTRDEARRIAELRVGLEVAADVMPVFPFPARTVGQVCSKCLRGENYRHGEGDTD